MKAQQKSNSPAPGFSSLDAFYKAAEPFVEFFNIWEAKLFTIIAGIDHLCYKCGSNAEFDQIRSLLEKFSPSTHLSTISDRRILLVELPSPFPTFLGDIWYLELCDQKPDGSQKAGFDHVTIYPMDGYEEGLVGRLRKHRVEVSKVVRPHCTTHEVTIVDTFKVHIAVEPLANKIKCKMK